MEAFAGTGTSDVLEHACTLLSRPSPHWAGQTLVSPSSKQHYQHTVQRVPAARCQVPGPLFLPAGDGTTGYGQVTFLGYASHFLVFGLFFSGPCSPPGLHPLTGDLLFALLPTPMLLIRPGPRPPTSLPKAQAASQPAHAALAHAHHSHAHAHARSPALERPIRPPPPSSSPPPPHPSSPIPPIHTPHSSPSFFCAHPISTIHPPR